MSGNVNHKGRRAEPRHIRLYHTISGCDAWRDLSGNAIKLLIAIARLDKGGDNGALFLSVRKAATEIGVNRNTAAKLFVELEEHGFIAATQRGHFKVKGGPATCWRLTWLGAPGHAPSRDFERWQRPVETKSRSQKRGAAVPKNGTAGGNAAPMVPENRTAPTETSHVSSNAPCSKTGTQIVSHGLGEPSAAFPGGKQGNSASGVSVDLLDALREQVGSYLKLAGVGAQTRLAEASRIPGGTLSKFLTGKGLNRSHFIQLQLELGRLQREAA
jgi:hypothetical protein